MRDAQEACNCKTQYKCNLKINNFVFQSTPGSSSIFCVLVSVFFLFLPPYLGAFIEVDLAMPRKIKRPLFLQSSFKEQGNLIQESPSVFWTFIGQSCKWGPFRLTESEFSLELDSRTFYPEFFDGPSRIMYFGNIAEVPQRKKKKKKNEDVYWQAA